MCEHDVIMFTNVYLYKIYQGQLYLVILQEVGHKDYIFCWQYVLPNYTQNIRGPAIRKHAFSWQELETKMLCMF